MKFLLIVFLFAFCEAAPGYSDSSYSENDLGQGTNGGYGGAYSYAGGGAGAGAGFPGNFPTFFPVFPQFDFNSFFNQLNRQHQEFIKQLQTLAEGQPGYSTGNYAPGYQGGYQPSAQGGYGGSAAGAASGSGAGYGGGYGGGYGVGNRGGFVGGYGGGYSGPDGNSYSFSGPIGNDAAVASGSIGPGGAHQYAAVYPENPNAPNVNTRFGASSGDDGGFKSVFTSSKSVTNNVGGKPQTFREASTTINDNGKVTTYTAHNP